MPRGSAGLDYHVEIEKHYYSVPHALLRETMWARITARTIEVFHRGKRVAAHVRSSSNRQHTTVREHMPSSHQRYADWTPERIQRQANEIGPKTSALVEIILRERTHPEQGFRACIGILRHATRASAASGSKPPVTARWRSARAPTPPSVNRHRIGTPDRRPKRTLFGHEKGKQAASERAFMERRSERAACGGQARLLNRQLSLPVSTMSQW